MVFAAGVTAGMDAALTVAARLRGVQAAQEIQLNMVYAPKPPFDSGTPHAAPPAVAAAARDAAAAITNRRLQTAIRLAAGLGVEIDDTTERRF